MNILKIVGCLFISWTLVGTDQLNITWNVLIGRFYKYAQHHVNLNLTLICMKYFCNVTA